MLWAWCARDVTKTLLREKRPGEEKEYTQGYKCLVQNMSLTKVKL